MKVLDKNIGRLLDERGVRLWKANLIAIRRNLYESLKLLGSDSWKDKGNEAE